MPVREGWEKPSLLLSSFCLIGGKSRYHSIDLTAGTSGTVTAFVGRSKDINRPMDRDC